MTQPDLRPGEGTGTGGAEEVPPALPDVVRARVLGLAAEGVGMLSAESLPPALRRVAGFAPARRAKLAGAQIASVLEADPEFRERLAAQVHALVGELGRAVLDGAPPPAADPVEVASAAYLLRGPRWVEIVTAAVAAVEEERGRDGSGRSGAEADRWRRRAEELQEEARQQRARAREQVDRLKSENVDLRRKLGESRARAKAAEESVRLAEETRAADAGAAAALVAAGEAEARRLRARIAELESELGVVRRTERAARSGESMRARVLLDGLVAAAQGLQRELGLPALDRLPADAVAAALVAPEGARTSAGRGSLASGDPALLEELLRLPRAHLVVDGYNVTKNAWPDLSLERQRERLLTGMASLVARTAAEATVVFDAAETRNRPLVTSPRGVRVLFSPYGVIADDVIRDLVAAEPAGRGVVVVTSDQAVARDVVAGGHRVVGSATLATLLART